MYALFCVRPIEVELKCRVLNFVLNCLNSDVGLVRSVKRHVISSLGCPSPIGCLFFSLPAIVPDEYYDLGYKHMLVMARDWTRFVKAPTRIIHSFERINAFVMEFINSSQISMMATYLTLMKSNQ